jgi:hypothetical protein
LKFKSYNVLCTTQTYKDFIQASKIHSESPFSHCSCYIDTRGVTDMSAKPCENYKMITVNYVDLWLVHTQVANQLKGAKLELRELKTHFLLLGACTSCPLLRSDLEASTVEIKDLKRQIDHSSHYSVLSPPCEMCGSLNSKLFYATKENTELK